MRKTRADQEGSNGETYGVFCLIVRSRDLPVHSFLAFPKMRSAGGVRPGGKTHEVATKAPRVYPPGPVPERKLDGRIGAGGGRAVGAPTLSLGRDIYQSIGVRPLINCKGTLTWVGGSQSLPEVKKAMDEASRHYVHLVELMDAVGQRLAELTGVEWGIVTSGCTAALAQATAAAIIAHCRAIHVPV